MTESSSPKKSLNLAAFEVLVRSMTPYYVAYGSLPIIPTVELTLPWAHLKNNFRDCVRLHALAAKRAKWPAHCWITIEDNRKI